MARNDRWRWMLGSAVLVSMAAAPAAAQDGGWTVVPRITSNLTWTDNVGLDPDASARDQTALDVTPGISISRQSSRLDADLNYRLQSQFFDDSDLNSTNHFLGARGTAALVENAFYVDVLANISQQVIDPAGRVSLNTVSGAQNRTEVGTYSVFPYWRGDIGTFARGQIGYQAGLVEYDDPALRDSKEGEIRILLTGNPTRRGFSWALNHTDATTDYDDSRQIDLARTSLQLNYPVTPKTRLILMGGADNNDVGVPTAQKIDGGFWQAGVAGQIGRFSSYEVRAGDHFYGGSYYGLFARQGRLLNLQVEYDETISTTGRDQLSYENLLNFLAEVTGLELPLGQDQVFVRKRLTASGGVSLAKTSVDARLYTETREYRGQTLTADDDDGVFGAAVGVGWQASDSTDLGLDLTWRQFDLRSSVNEPEDTTLRLTMKRRLGNGFDLNAQLWHNRRSASLDQQEYKENAVSIGIGKSF